MTARICPHHGDLVRELALGRLDDVQAGQAEVFRAECEECTAWWDETFAGDAFAEVDFAVADAFSNFSAPVRRNYGWLAAAAALVLAIGLGSTTMLWRNGDTEYSKAATPTPNGAVLTVMDFESGSLEVVPAASVVDDAISDNGEEAIFESNLESGSLSSWSSHS